MDPRHMQPGSAGKDAPVGLTGTAVQGQSSGWGADPASTGPARTTSSHFTARGGLAKEAGAVLSSVQEESGSSHREHRGLGDAVRAALCLQDSRGQCCSQGGVGFSSLKLPAAAPALRATA